MEMILSGVAELGRDPRAWAVAALVALKAAHSVYLYLRCPVMRGVSTPTPEMIAVARAYHFGPTPRYLIVMLVGIALAIGGLYMINNAAYGALALGCLVIGVFMFTTEPNRLEVKRAEMEVFATSDADQGASGETNALTRDRLRAAHRSHAFTEVVIVLAVLAMLSSF